MNKTSVFLAAAVLAGPAFAQANDDCGGAIALAADTQTPYDTTAATTSAEAWTCALGGTDLWYSYTSTMDNSSVVIETCGSSYDTAVEVFTGTCGALTLASCNDDFCGLQSSATVASATAGTTFVFRVGGFNGAAGLGTILISESVNPPDPCDTPDALESNTDCASATPLGDGMFMDLNVEETDNDYYAVTVPNGGTLNVDIFFLNALGDVDLYLWDPSVECDTNVAGTGGAWLARGFSASDDETISYVNTSGMDQDLIIEIDMFSVGACNEYDMTIDGAGMGDGGIGTSYCMANANSTGAAASIIATGSAAVADNDVTLVASDLPTNQFGFFLASLNQGFVANPGGSEGNLCLGGVIGRYNGLGQVAPSNAMGELSIAIDLTAIPTPQGTVAAVPGDNYNFQAWFRDNGTSNLTDGYTVMFN